MNAHVDHVLLEALALQPEDRSLVALSLLDSLQDEGISEDAVDASWVAEARRRNEAISSGRETAMPVEEFRNWFYAL